MGLLNPRARCPHCGGKIHVSRIARRAPEVCQHCGAPLEGLDLIGLRVKGSRQGRTEAEREAIRENRERGIL